MTAAVKAWWKTLHADEKVGALAWAGFIAWAWWGWVVS